MHTIPSHPNLRRRDALKFMAITSVTTVGGYILYESAPWLDYDQHAIPTRRPINSVLTDFARKRELIRYATLAANGHNAQPWRFTIANDSIEIHPDFTRRLPIVDPFDRELWISLGCALENLLVAARVLGYEFEVLYPDTADMIRVHLSKGRSYQDPLFDAIPLRQTTRSDYDGRPIPSAGLDQLQGLSLEPGVTLQLATSAAVRETVLEYVIQGNLHQYADPAFIDELLTWLRFNKREAIASADGLYSRCSGNPEVPRWFGELVVASTNPGQQADVDAAKLRSSPAIFVIASEADSKTAWVRTGQVYERLALQSTALNIKSALLNQPVEVAQLRAQFQSAIGLGMSLPQLILRMGYAHAMPRSLRRPVDQVIVKG
jgi:hypothetical protein